MNARTTAEQEHALLDIAETILGEPITITYRLLRDGREVVGVFRATATAPAATASQDRRAKGAGASPTDALLDLIDHVYLERRLAVPLESHLLALGYLPEDWAGWDDHEKRLIINGRVAKHAAREGA